MEGMVNRQLLNFLEKNFILSPNQFGFRQGKGAADLLTYLHNQWSNVAGAGGAVHVLAVDIAGAFDRVSHAGVLEKARCYGIRGRLLCWLRHYLKERKLCTVVHGQTSSLYPITAGVPQGSILGPTLFLLYINDCDVNLPDDVHIAIYADDTTLYTTIPTQYDICQRSRALQQAASNNLLEMQ